MAFLVGSDTRPFPTMAPFISFPRQVTAMFVRAIHRSPGVREDRVAGRRRESSPPSRTIAGCETGSADHPATRPPPNMNDISSVTNASIHLACKSATYSTGSLRDNPTKSTEITPPRKPEIACEAHCGASLNPRPAGVFGRTRSAERRLRG